MASTFSVVRALRVAFWAAGAIALAQAASAQTPPAAQAPAQPAQAQEVRDELDKLRKEFESVRDAYGARLTALEEKLATMGVPPTAAPAAPPAQAAAPPAAPAGAPPTQAAAPPVDVPVPPGAAGEGGPTGSLPVYSNASAMSKIFNPDIAVIGNFLGAGGRNSINPTPAFGLDEAEATFQAVVDPYARADFFLVVLTGGRRDRRGLPDADRRCRADCWRRSAR